MTLKNIIKLVFCSGAMVIMAACASTTETANSAVAVAPQAAAIPGKVSSSSSVAEVDETKKKCKRQATVGSNFKRKVCMTIAQWNEMENNSRVATEHMQRRNRGVDVGN